MKHLYLIIPFVLLLAFGEGLVTNYLNTELQKCLNCLCHARTGCWSRFNCARYSISFDYWKTANSPVVNSNDLPNDHGSYTKCMNNENCILATLDQYVEAIGRMDCNCDGVFDCKDRFAIHLYGSQCSSPKFSTTYATRFNRCARQIGVKEMLEAEGFDGCTPEVF